MEAATYPTPAQWTPKVTEAFAKLRDAVDPAGFARVGGDVAFVVKGAKPAAWQVTSLGGHVQIRPGNAPFPVCTIGIIPEALLWLVEGTLDVQRAFAKKRMAVEGDLEALGRFVACFEFQTQST